MLLVLDYFYMMPSLYFALWEVIGAKTPTDLHPEALPEKISAVGKRKEAAMAIKITS